MTLRHRAERVRGKLTRPAGDEASNGSPAMDAIVIAGEADGRILHFDTAAERLFRCPATEAAGQPLDRFLAKEFLLTAATETPTLLQGVRGDGEAFSAEAAISHIELAGQRLCIVSVRDGTEPQTEQTWRTLSRAIEHSPDGVFITDKEGIIQYLNPAFCRLIGFQRDQVIGRKPSMFQSGQHDRQFYQRLWSTLHAGNVYRGVFIDKTGRGDLIHLEETIAPLRDVDGNITYFVAAAHDVTHHIRAEEALRRLNESLERQAKRIAQALHDEAGQLLTTAHIALSEAARDLPPTAVERLKDVRSNLDAIEEQLRRVAHELRPQILEDLGLVPAIEFLAQGIKQRHGIAVTVETALQSRLPAVVETTLYRLVQEALTNASKHAQATRVNVRLEQARRTLRCTVEDDGVGFDASPASAPLGERGMGLSSIRDQLEALGGTFQINSAPKQGARLTIAIPLEE